MLVSQCRTLKTLEVPLRVDRELPKEPAVTALQDTDPKEQKGKNRTRRRTRSLPCRIIKTARAEATTASFLQEKTTEF